jgi:hypothetical protein
MTKAAIIGLCIRSSQPLLLRGAEKPISRRGATEAAAAFAALRKNAGFVFAGTRD